MTLELLGEAICCEGESVSVCVCVGERVGRVGAGGKKVGVGRPHMLERTTLVPVQRPALSV